MNKEIESYDLILGVKSPLHIGSGDEYDIFDFYLDENNKEIVLYNKQKFIESLDENKRENLENLAIKSDIIKIVEFINENAKQIEGVKIKVPNDFVNLYKECLKEEIGFNKFEFSRFQYNPINNLPYIPGSSIKGAIRTAYLNHLNKSNKKTYSYYIYTDKKGQIRYNSQKLESDLIGGRFSSDIFSNIKVSDFIPYGDIKDIKRQIKFAVNFKKDTNNLAKGPYQILETITQGKFRGTINLMKPFPRNINIAINELIGYCKNFYNNSKSDDFNIIIGRHSGAENVTIEGCRRIYVKKKGYLDNSTTVWLASDKRKPQNTNNLLEFGKCLLTL